MRQRTTQRRTWTAAALLTLLIHAGVVVGVAILDLFSPSVTSSAIPEPLQLVFAQEPAPASPPDADSAPFTELPPDRADEAPEEADFLSNVDSRARDKAPGGEAGAMPRLQGDSEAPDVRMDAGVPVPEAGEGGADVETAEAESAQPPASDRPLGGTLLEPPSEEPALDNPETDPVPPTASRSMDMLRKRGAGGSLERMLTPEGMSDLFQEEMHNPDGNAGLSGDISLNTLEWDYAPWLLRFKRDFVKSWFAPYAYYLGMIHGWTLVRLEIAHDGTIEKLDVVDEEGDIALTQANISAFRTAAPFRPLPDGFPEERLVLRIKLIYPEVTRR